MTRQEFYVKWGIPASYALRDDLIAALSDDAAPACACGWIYFRNGQGDLVTDHACRLSP